MEQNGTVSESALRAAQDVRTVFSRLRRRLKETYDNRDLTPTQTAVLSRLSKEGPASTSDLAAAERVRPQSMAATVGLLEERGLVRRRPDPGDGRRQLVSLTRAGERLVDDRRRAGNEWLTRALEDHASERERQVLIEAMAVLDRIARL